MIFSDEDKTLMNLSCIRIGNVAETSFALADFLLREDIDSLNELIDSFNGLHRD